MSEPFIGEIILFAGNFAIRGYAFCNGQLLPISQNQALFSILGTTYGGDGRTTFSLPDLRGRAPVHSGLSQGPGLSNRPLGQKSGFETTTRSVLQMANHNHGASSTSQIHVSEEDGTTTDPSGSFLATSTNNTNVYHTANDAVMNSGAVTTTTTTANAGGSQSANNMQPFLALNYEIALTGIFPSRS